MAKLRKIKQYRIAFEELEDFLDPSVDEGFPKYKKWVVDVLVDHGFDRNKPIRERFSLNSDHIIYEQED
jgi:methionine synthase II (cobalamin-independent)